MYSEEGGRLLAQLKQEENRRGEAGKPVCMNLPPPPPSATAFPPTVSLLEPAPVFSPLPLRSPPPRVKRGPAVALPETSLKLGAIDSTKKSLLGILC